MLSARLYVPTKHSTNKHNIHPNPHGSIKWIYIYKKTKAIVKDKVKACNCNFPSIIRISELLLI